jgi:uncharacterized membrane protein HdeD (DUF308 family)
MKSLTDILIAVLGMVTLLAGVWQLMVFVGFKDAKGQPDMWAGVSHLYVAIVAIVIAVACVVAYFIRHPRIEEEIHVTK